MPKPSNSTMRAPTAGSMVLSVKVALHCEAWTELPNVTANYKNFHEQGFEVVGISLDRSREPLEKFIEKEELPWAQLYDEEIQKGTGWNHPLAQFYGISAIPAAILVDQDGKVISMKARGPELTKLLEKLLGKAE